MRKRSISSEERKLLSDFSAMSDEAFNAMWSQFEGSIGGWDSSQCRTSTDEIRKIVRKVEASGRIRRAVWLNWFSGKRMAAVAAFALVTALYIRIEFCLSALKSAASMPTSHQSRYVVDAQDWSALVTSVSSLEKSVKAQVPEVSYSNRLAALDTPTDGLLWRKSGATCVLPTVSSHVVSLGFSPDGTKVLTSHGSTTRVWDVGTGAPLELFDASTPKLGDADTLASSFVFTADPFGEHSVERRHAPSKKGLALVRHGNCWKVGGVVDAAAEASEGEVTVSGDTEALLKFLRDVDPLRQVDTALRDYETARSLNDDDSATPARR
jgi:WD40 repeat protein